MRYLFMGNIDMHHSAVRDDVERRFESALEAYLSKNLAAAAEGCTSILAFDHTHFDSRYLLGLCHGRAGRADLGLSLIKRAMAQGPSLEHYDFKRGQLSPRKVEEQLQFREELFLRYRMFKLVDAFLISYPKCGRTWLRLLLGKYVIGPAGRGDPLEVRQLTYSNPEFSSLEVSHDDYPHWKRADRVVTNKQAYAGKKVIFLVRDPRDTLVSYYFQYTKRGDKNLAEDAGFNGTLSEFIRHDIGGLRSLVAFYNAWARSRDVPSGFLVVRYEDMIRDARAILQGVVAFLEWPMRDPSFFDEVVAFGTFDNMRMIEETNALNNARLQAPKDRDPESFKVRRGKVGGYIDYLEPEDIRYIDGYLKEHLDDYFSDYKRPAVP